MVTLHIALHCDGGIIGLFTILGICVAYAGQVQSENVGFIGLTVFIGVVAVPPSYR